MRVPPMKNTNTFSKSSQRGFTLVELLVVLVLATVVLSIAIPRIRAVNKERNIREAARVVGSAFATASQRASIDGIAGVRLTRNPNFVDGFGYQFAATQISLLRNVPGFSGDQLNSAIGNAVDEAAGAPYFNIDIDLPFEQDELSVVRAGDTISFNTSSMKYRIHGVHPREDENSTVNDAKMRLELERGTNNYLPEPTDNANFTIHRQPRILKSSLATLPDNFIIDLRFSGFEVMDAGDPSIPLPPQLTTVFEPLLVHDIEFIFDEEGGIDRMFYKNAAGATVATRVPLGPVNLFITESPESVDVTEEVATTSDIGLWVSVSSNTGSTNIGYNNSASSRGLTNQILASYYNAPADPDFDPEMDRDEFNQIMRSCRENSLRTVTTQ